MSASAAELRDALLIRAPAFAALGDPTRLSVVAALAGGETRSIRALSQETSLTRQGLTKHLKVLEDAGVLTSHREGRESLFRLERDTIADLAAHLDAVGAQWDDALRRLKGFVEE